MKSYRSIVGAFALGCLLVLACGCSSSRNPLLGSWDGVSGPGVADRIEFFKDGTVKATQYGSPIRGTYQLLGPDRVSIDFTFEYTFWFEIDGRELTLEQDGGGTFVYRK
ncbi:hypothetical protein IH601_06835 [Candidatus Bipolaricaulota bacterium]|nr:hypothetical protein [Candidatus Bipolaricaulota bacterium]TFH07105.1 MAG: hypothetical protein E4H08_10060 [Candidatus Atribacteria bacterium]